jgi:aspartate-semialdehyde dehydrogenase
MTKQYNVAVVGATGIVGKTLLSILAERQFPIGNLYLLASDKSVGKQIIFKEKSYSVIALDDFSFKGVDFSFFSAGSAVSEKFAPKAAAAGSVVIDKSSYFRNDNDVPLIVPEVNVEALKNYQARNIIACPNCSTTQLVVALKPIYDAVGIKRLNVATYQSVSGSGQGGLIELMLQFKAIMEGQAITSAVYPQQIAFNVVPHIDAFHSNGYTGEEMKIMWETRKILGDPTLQINVTAVRVPVQIGHSMAVNIETRDKVTAAQVVDLLLAAPGIQIMNSLQNNGYPTSLHPASGTDPVYVGRIREDISHPHGINLWVVADNTRKGAALNAVQVAELLCQ